VALRFAPRLSYHLDDSLKKQAEILRKINEVTAEDAANKRSAKEGNDAP
jgi:ribosome-binding factor A